MRFVCVVLAGGEGRRIGGAKPLQPFGGGTLIARALELARSYSDDVAVAVRDAGQVGEVDATLIVDDPHAEGPLGGLAAALRYARSRGSDGVLTIPCDAPRLPSDLAQRLAAELEETPTAGATVASSGGQLHPVCALWRTSILDALPAYTASGRRSLRGLADARSAAIVEWPLEPADPFANANTTAELAALQPGRTTR